MSAEDIAEAVASAAAPPPPTPPAGSDDQLAATFAERHRDDLRHVAARRGWRIWDGQRWAADDLGAVMEAVRAELRWAADGDKSRTAIDLCSAKTVAAVERLARSDPRLAARPEDFDRDPWLLNTPAGVVDLRTGDCRASTPGDMLSQITAAGPEDGDRPIWAAFLARITAGDGDLNLYLQRLAGYCLTGSIREQKLFFLHGTGNNGKSVFLNTLAGILADYATVLPIEALMASRGDRHPTELAGLAGARLVAAKETDAGRRWDEAKVKALTGGDPIAVRFMHADFFTLRPVCKLVILGNHRPALRNIDEAIRRRLNLVPFTVTIPDEEVDQDMEEKLRAEWPAIAAWAIDGAVVWGGEGLRAPDRVTAATDDYFGGEDQVARWIEDRCQVDAAAPTAISELFADWRKCAEAAGERPGSMKRLSRALQDRGFRRIRSPVTDRWGFQGLALR